MAIILRPHIMKVSKKCYYPGIETEDTNTGEVTRQCWKEAYNTHRKAERASFVAIGELSITVQDEIILVQEDMIQDVIKSIEGEQENKRST